VRSIREIAPEIKASGRYLGKSILGDWGLFILVILAVTASFGMGRLSVLLAPNRAILTQNTASAASDATGAGQAIQGAYIGSKTGSLYYYPWCSGAQRIAPEDRRWFVDEKAAQKAGYRPGSGCKGLE
jgi:hypothetical protein